MARDRIRPKATSSDSRGVARVVGGLFVALGAVLTYVILVRPVALVVAARGWEERSCTILSSEVAESTDSDGDATYRVALSYEYEWRNQTYRGDRYNFSTGSSSGYDGKKRVVDRYPAGTRATCYVNPRDPSKSVINREPGPYLLVGLFPLLFVGAGGAVLVYSFRARSPARAPLPVPSAPAASAGGELVLKPSVSNHMALVGSLVFAAVWNGIVSVFVFAQLLPSFARGSPDWFLLFFLVPFVAVGLGVVGFVVYRVLCLWNPLPELRLRPASLYPGGPGELSWSLSGDVHRVKSLNVSLKAREAVTYRQGTDTRTEHHEIYAHTVYESRRADDFRRSSADIAVPADAMPSFNASNNKIEWFIEVRGEIPKWPDIGSTFPITVLPYADTGQS